MAKIIDPDLLVRSSTFGNIGTDGNIWIDTTTKLIYLDVFGSLSTDGVSLQALYSYLKEEWKDDTNLIKFSFPMESITEEQFEFFNGWDLGDTTTKNLIRDGGWALKDGTGTSQEEYANITTLGAFNDSGVDQAYYLQSIGGTSTDVVLTGEVNQAVKIYGDATHGNFDYRGFFKIFLREQGKTYASYDLITEQNISSITYKKYALPLSNGIDLKITASDNDIDTTTPYTNMSITWYGTPQSRTIGASSYDFSIIIDGASGTAEQIYEFVQRELRQTTDIDDGAGSEIGNISDEMLEFVGDTLKTKYTADGGVYIDNFLPADTNRIVFVDDTNTERTFPYVAAGSINFNDNLVNATDAKYVMFYTNSDAGSLISTAISFANATSTITYTPGNALIDFRGLIAGQLIVVSGSANNNGTFTVVSTTQYTVVVSEALTDEAAGSSVTIVTNFDFDTAEAVLVKDADDINISGLVDGNSQIQFTYDYDGNVQRGPSSYGTNAPITVVAIATNTAQYVKATSTITQSTQNVITLVAPLERNYSNPA